MLEPLIISARIPGNYPVLSRPRPVSLITNNETERRRNSLIPSITKSESFSFTQTPGWQERASRSPGPGSHLTPGQMWCSYDRWVLYHKIWADFRFLSPFKHCVGPWLVTRHSLRVWRPLSVTWSSHDELLSGPGYENCVTVIVTSWQCNAVSRHNCVTWARVKTDTRTWVWVIITTRHWGVRTSSSSAPRHRVKIFTTRNQLTATILWKYYKIQICLSVWFLLRCSNYW